LPNLRLGPWFAGNSTATLPLAGCRIETIDFAWEKKSRWVSRSSFQETNPLIGLAGKIEGAPSITKGRLHLDVRPTSEIS
jgi:hypothetical protein